MNTKETDDVLAFINELQDAKAELDKAKADGIKKTLKQKLNYLFSPSVKSRVNKLSSSKFTDGFNDSDVARAAMYIGLSQLEEAVKEKDERRVRGLLHLAKLRSSLGK